MSVAERFQTINVVLAAVNVAAFPHGYTMVDFEIFRRTAFHAGVAIDPLALATSFRPDVVHAPEVLAVSLAEPVNGRGRSPAPIARRWRCPRRQLA